MDSEKLIEIVQQFIFLYDQEDKRYSDNVKKEKAWNEIGKMLCRSGVECKKNWNSLRDSLRRALKKRREGRSVKKWRFEDEMSFLIPYIKERATKTPVSNELSDVSDYDIKEISEATNSSLSEKDYCHGSATPVNQNDNLQTSIKNQVSKRKNEQPETSMIKHFMNNRIENPEQEVNSSNDIDLFFNSMAATVKKLSPYNQAIAKANVFSTISQLEIEELSPTSCPTSALSAYSSD